MPQYKTIMQTIRGPMEEKETTDPIAEMIGHNIGKLQTMHAFKMAGIVHPARDKAEERKNRNIRSYNHTLETIAGSVDWLEREHAGRKFRQEMGKWAKVLYKDGRRKVLAFHGSGVTSAEGRAYMDASKAIIDAFKQL